MPAGEFTRAMFGDRASFFDRHLEHFRGRPGLRFLEIGSFEGESAVWMTDGILTGDDSWLVCVDPWAPSDEFPGVDWNAVLDRFTMNVRHRGVRAHRGTFPERFDEIRVLYGARFDFIYIDGSHHASDVLTDSVLAWQLLKVGGLLCWDDAGWKPDGRPEWDKPITAITAFLSCFDDKCEPLSSAGEYQIWIRRTA